jgi:hypothetical protein
MKIFNEDIVNYIIEFNMPTAEEVESNRLRVVRTIWSGPNFHPKGTIFDLCRTIFTKKRHPILVWLFKSKCLKAGRWVRVAEPLLMFGHWAHKCYGRDRRIEDRWEQLFECSKILDKAGWSDMLYRQIVGIFRP